MDNRYFSYLVPEQLAKEVSAGSIVRIPFGKKKIRGLVLRIENERGATDFILKEILSVEKYTLGQKYFEIIDWISRYYLCSLGEALSLFLPPDIKNSVIASTRTREPINCSKKLTSDQSEVLAKINNVKDNKPILLHGVTGSGKTELYIKLIEQCLKNNRQAVFLIPEIMLAAQTITKLQECFPENIALYHSNLSGSEKFKSYVEFNFGTKNILVGPRSALAVPAKNLGLIIIDEEHDDAYKQEHDPRYHAVDLAKIISLKTKARLILGSATPRIESYWAARNGHFHLVELKNRYGKLMLPQTKIIDLKDEIAKENFSPVSQILQERIAKTLKDGRQVILLLNRLGMATFVSCRECGEVINCPNCNIPLVYHINKTKEILSCHHCDYEARVPRCCPKCKGVKIKYFGAGIEKIEKEIKYFFPKAKILVADSKSLSSKGGYDRLNRDLREGKIDILIGTQIVAKGLDIPAVDLVGVISADTGLHLPHFRANEKTFQLLTQVSGRSGRRDSLGETIIQSYWPTSKAIKLAGIHDYKAFFDQEIIERKKFNYPPYCRLVRIVCENADRMKVKQAIDNIAKQLREAKFDFIGPGPCFFAKLRNKYRYHVIIKIDKLPDESLYEIFRQNQYVTWDADPTGLL